MKLDVLAVAAHPDDVELCAGGTVCSLVDQGHKVGIVDCTRGELGSRGSVEIRDKETEAASRIMGISVRYNLQLADGYVTNDRKSREPLMEIIRRHQPTIILANAPVCRHPDHCAAAELAVSASFFSGLSKIQLFEPDGIALEPWRPSHILHYMQSVSFEPDIVVDVSRVWDQRMEALLAYRSQFYNADYHDTAGEGHTFVSNPDFLKWVESRARTFGYPRGFTYGEPFQYRNGPIGVMNLMTMLGGDRDYV